MELVPGETLKGPLALAMTLHCAKQIADAFRDDDFSALLLDLIQ